MPVQSKFTVKVGGAAPNPWDFQPRTEEQSLALTIRAHYQQEEKECEEIAQGRYPISYDSEKGMFVGKVEEHYVDKAIELARKGVFSGNNFYHTSYGRVEWKYAGGIGTQEPGKPIYHADYDFIITLF